MFANSVRGPDCRECTLNIEWHDCSFCPAITLRSGLDIRRGAPAKPLPGAALLPHPARRRNLFQPMKKIGTLKSKTARARGFTLIELLVVIAIIAILAAMLLPAVNAAKIAAQKAKAKTEIADIVNAINAYDMDYGRFPVSPAAQAAAGTNDFTYGGTFNGYSFTIGTAGYNTNTEVMAILMDITDTTVTAVNQNHQKNPKQVKYLSPKRASDKSYPGVGPDLVYRDPWGNPYVITMDLNYNESCEDVFYKLPAVSGGGLNGLTLQPDSYYAFHGKVMVWSAGPDGQIDTSKPANRGVNSDNVLNWQQ